MCISWCWVLAGPTYKGWGEKGGQAFQGVCIWYLNDVPLYEVLIELCGELDVVPCLGQGIVRL